MVASSARVRPKAGRGSPRPPLPEESPSVILTVTLNAALDITYEVDRLVPESSHRVRRVWERAGGKGVNVSRVLAALGRDTVATGLVGGATGEQFRGDLREAGLRDAFLPISGTTRRTVAVVSEHSGDASIFNEPGPTVLPGEWQAFTRDFTALAGTAAVVVLSGSVPPGLPVDAYGELVRLAREAGALTVLDASGEALRTALAQGPDLVKPNAAELREATDCVDVAAAAALMRGWGATAVVASSGPDGLYAETADGAWRAAAPEQLRGNPTGAGDACVAALAAGLADGNAWPDLLREAVALSGAAVVAPRAGDVDRATYRRLLSGVVVKEASPQ